MKLQVEYKSKDPLYSDFTQIFIGEDIVSCEDQMYEFDEWLDRNGKGDIYKRNIYEKK